MSDPVSKMIGGDRTTVRVPIPAGVEAWVEIRLGERRWRRPLLDISESGISLEGSGGLPELAPGSTFVDTVVRVGDCEIHGTMVVCHITPSISTGTVYGARFHPPSKADRARLNGLVERCWAGSSKTETEPAEPDPCPIPSQPDGDPTHSLQCRHCLGNLTRDELIDGSICPYCLQELRPAKTD